MTIPRRRLAQRQGLPAGALRWLLGARTQLLYPTGNSTHGAVTRWRYLIIHQNTREQWETFQESYWNEMRNSIIMWHRNRGWRAPPSHLRGHEAERAWLANERRTHPRGRYEIKPGTVWGLERTFQR